MVVIRSIFGLVFVMHLFVVLLKISAMNVLIIIMSIVMVLPVWRSLIPMMAL